VFDDLVVKQDSEWRGSDLSQKENNMKKLLLVDDEKNIRLFYREEFQDEGYDVVTAPDGTTALKEFETNRPDLVVLDLQMPGMNGIEVLRRMKQIDSQVPVIICTAYHDYKQELGTWASEEYIVKSADLTNLKDAVRRHLGENGD